LIKKDNTGVNTVLNTGLDTGVNTRVNTEVDTGDRAVFDGGWGQGV